MNCYNCDSPQLVCDTTKDAYVCQNCGYEYPKQYFFVSHSHKDIEKVRIIRNIIEETFFYEPILFFLKSVSDENELNSLLKREIAERIWFVYCNSKNAENSKYVQFERNYINQLISEGKKFNFIDIELSRFNIWNRECYDYIRKQISYQIRKTKIFMSYSHHDTDCALGIMGYLKNEGYSVWFDQDMQITDTWANAIESQIKNHSYKDGLVLLLITKNSINSRVVLNEGIYAIDNGALVLPVVITTSEDRATLLNRLFQISPWLRNIPSLVLDNVDKKNLSQIIDAIKVL